MKKCARLIPLVFSILCLATYLRAQDLVGVLDGHIFSINKSDASITKVADINYDADALETDIAYSPSDCLFYTVIDRSNNPSLVSVDLNGEVNEIGKLGVDGELVNTVEAIAYNPSDGLIYISSSLNGGDAFAEAILSVDVVTANCSFVQFVNSNLSIADLDNMCFSEEAMYFSDGIPGSDLTRFYRIPHSSLGTSADPELIHTSDYQGGADLAKIGDRLYFHNLSLQIRYLDLNQLNIGIQLF